MNIEQAKLIPLDLILEKIGCKSTKQKPHEAWYSSPLRAERTPSFHVNTKQNLWYDFGEGRGGDTITLVCAYLKNSQEHYTVADALRWLRNMTGSIPVIAPIKTIRPIKEEPKLVLKSRKKIQHPALVQYLKKRGIPLYIGHEYLQEVRILNKDKNKTFFALGFPNEDEGFEIRNPYFKSCVGIKAITFIRGTTPKPMGIHLFEGMMDYLSVVTNQEGKRFDDDTIILNSISLLNKATPYIHSYGYRLGFTWLDNDKTGQKGTTALADYFKTQELLEHRPMNDMYAPHKDVNAWHMHKLGLTV